jgi:imidazolonepropionase
MWDRLLVDCHIATMVPAPNNSLGIIENGAIAIEGGRILRVGKRTELAGFRAKEVVACGGAWVTPGLVDCHTHLIFGGTRADEASGRALFLADDQLGQVGPAAHPFAVATALA